MGAALGFQEGEEEERGGKLGGLGVVLDVRVEACAAGGVLLLTLIARDDRDRLVCRSQKGMPGVWP